MRDRARFKDQGGFAAFGVLGDTLIAIAGAFVGVFYGESALAAIGTGDNGFGTLILSAGLGAFIFLFIANLFRVISGPIK